MGVVLSEDQLVSAIARERAAGKRIACRRVIWVIAVAASWPAAVRSYLPLRYEPQKAQSPERAFSAIAAIMQRPSMWGGLIK